MTHRPTLQAASRSVLVAVALACSFGAAHAQDKKALVQRILELQKPAYEAMAQQLTLEPAQQMLARAAMLTEQRVPPEKREALAKEVQADVKKYMDEASPVVRAAAVKLAPATVGTLFEEKFTEDELKQIITLLESPVLKKYQQQMGEMQRALSTKVVAETTPTVRTKLQAFEQSLTRRLNAAIGAPAAASGTAPAKAPAK